MQFNVAQITEPRDNHENFISGWLTNLNKANRIKELSAERMKNWPDNCQSFVVNLPIYLNSVLTNLLYLNCEFRKYSTTRTRKNRKTSS